MKPFIHKENSGTVSC